MFATQVVAQTNINLGGLNTDPSSAVEVNAESLAVDQESGTATFSGNVVIGQGELRISADKVEVVYGSDTNEIDSFVASGGVTFVTATETAEAQNAAYDLGAGIITLTGDVLLTQGPSAISADRMVVNVADGTSQVDGNVRTIFQQGDN